MLYSENTNNGDYNDENQLNNSSSPLSPSPLNLNVFPLEILIIILSYVDPLTLKNIPMVCKTWYHILQDDTIWNAIFKLQYPFKTEIFPSITRSDKFKIELIFRTQLRYNYRRGRLLNQQYTINHHIASGSTVSIDWNRNKLIIIDVPRETILTCDVRNGKSTKFATDFLPEGITSYDTGTNSGSLLGSRVLVFGRWDGSVSGALLDWKGLLLSDVHNWGSMSGGRVTCVTACINPASQNNDYNRLNLKGNENYFSSLPLLSSNSSSSINLQSNLSSSSSSSLSKKKVAITPPPTVTPTPRIKSHNVLAKSGSIGAFSCDESGFLYGWDIRTGDCLCKYSIPTNDNRVVKLQSDGKSVVIAVLENGDILVVKNIFELLKNDNLLTNVSISTIGQLPFDRNGLIGSLNLYVDYGGKSVVVWNDLELSIFSYDGTQNHHKLTYSAPENTVISYVKFECNNKLFMKRDTKIVGSDPLLAAICLNTGIIEIINSREHLSSSKLKPINKIVPNFLTEHQNDLVFNQLDPHISKTAAVCLNSLVIAVSNHLGKVEIFDVMTGEFLRTVIDRIGKKKLQEIENILPNRIINSPIKLYLDEFSTRGVLIIGSHIQYFLCGNSKNDDSEEQQLRKKNFKSNKRVGNDKKGDFKEDVDHTLNVYEENKIEKKKQKDLIAKYNGEIPSVNPLDEQDQLNMALVMSMSLNESASNITNNDDGNIADEEQKQLDEALRLSLLSTGDQENIDINNSNLIQQGTSGESDLKEEDGEMDDDLLRAIELSKLENYKTWDNGEDPQEQWETLR